jgi:hypothetical protein
MQCNDLWLEIFLYLPLKSFLSRLIINREIYRQVFCCDGFWKCLVERDFSLREIECMKDEKYVCHYEQYLLLYYVHRAFPYRYPPFKHVESTIEDGGTLVQSRNVIFSKSRHLSEQLRFMLCNAKLLSSSSTVIKGEGESSSTSITATSTLNLIRRRNNRSNCYHHPNQQMNFVLARERFGLINRSHYRNTDAFIIVFDMDDENNEFLNPICFDTSSSLSFGCVVLEEIFDKFPLVNWTAPEYRDHRPVILFVAMSSSGNEQLTSNKVTMSQIEEYCQKTKIKFVQFKKERSVSTAVNILEHLVQNNIANVNYRKGQQTHNMETSSSGCIVC